MTRTLKEKERDAINRILEEAERRFDGGASASLEAIDRQCREIWSDWDTSSIPSRQTPRSREYTQPTITVDSTETKLSPQSQTHPLEIEDSNPPPDREVSHSRIPQRAPIAEAPASRYSREVIEQSLDSSSDDDIGDILTERLRKKRNPISDEEIPELAQTEKQRRRKNPTQKKSTVNAFSRNDIARLRRTIIEQTTQIRQLNDALDRANAENARLSGDVERLKKELAKQKNLVSFLKENNLYGHGSG